MDNTLISVMLQKYNGNLTLVLISLLLEIFFYFGASIIGTIVRNLTQHNKFRFWRDLGLAIISTAILFALGNYFKAKVSDARMIFLVCIGISAYLPQFLLSVKSATFISKVVGIFSPKIGQVLEEMNKKDAYDPVMQGERRRTQAPREPWTDEQRKQYRQIKGKDKQERVKK